MHFRLAADAVLLLHLAFIGFAVFGGLLALRWRRMPLLHLPAVAWAVYVELTGSLCPLTAIENSFRLGAGQSGYAGGFVEHYLFPLVYPPGLTREVQWILAAGVAGINIAVYSWLAFRRPSSARKPDA
ncbi:MAG: hypothetical protein JWP79_2529 [Polaromonas sp.]|jgi:hypothetical protein|nr:hypothetical protein [Polaromonas sp.]